MSKVEDVNELINALKGDKKANVLVSNHAKEVCLAVAAALEANSSENILKVSLVSRWKYSYF